MTLRHSFILVLFTFSAITVKAQTYQEQYEKYSQALKKMTEVDSVYFELVKIRDSCLVGIYAPNFTVNTVDNETIELSKLKGQVVVLNFWFTKCEPCIKEMPYFNKLADTFSGKGVAFISFAPEDTLKVKEFLLKHPFKFKTIANSEIVRRDIFKLFSIWPYTIIIDKTGKINKMNYGILDDETFPVYKKLIAHLLE